MTKASLATVPADHLFLREGTTYTKIPLSKVLYIEADGNYSHLYTVDKSYSIKRSLALIAETLPEPPFVRVARGIIVNFDKVNSLSFADATIDLGDRIIKMGKAYHTTIREVMPRL